MLCRTQQISPRTDPRLSDISPSTVNQTGGDVTISLDLESSPDTADPDGNDAHRFGLHDEEEPEDDDGEHSLGSGDVDVAGLRGHGNRGPAYADFTR